VCQRTTHPGAGCVSLVRRPRPHPGKKRTRLDLAGVQAHLTRRAYRPDWTLTAYLGDTTRQVMLRIAAEVEDSYHPGERVPLDIRSPIPRFALETELAFDKWLAWRVSAVELHEAQEWFRKPSKADPDRWVPVFNPHAEGADRDQWPIVKGVPST
jgi:hypothetical protein